MLSRGHDLDTRSDRRAHSRRQRVDGDQETVHTHTHFHAIFERFDVDVGGLLVHGARDDVLYKANDRRFAGHVFEALNVVFVGGIRSFSGWSICGALRPLSLRSAVKGFERELNVAFGRDRNSNVPVREIGKRGNGFCIEWIGNCEFEIRFCCSKRENSVGFEISRFNIAKSNGESWKFVFGNQF